MFARSTSPLERIKQLKKKSEALLAPLRKALTQIKEAELETFNSLIELEIEIKEREDAMKELQVEQITLVTYRTSIEKTLGITYEEEVDN